MGGGTQRAATTPSYRAPIAHAPPPIATPFPSHPHPIPPSPHTPSVIPAPPPVIPAQAGTHPTPSVATPPQHPFPSHPRPLPSFLRRQEPHPTPGVATPLPSPSAIPTPPTVIPAQAGTHPTPRRRHTPPTPRRPTQTASAPPRISCLRRNDGKGGAVRSPYDRLRLRRNNARASNESITAPNAAMPGPRRGGAAGKQPAGTRRRDGERRPPQPGRHINPRGCRSSSS